VDRCRHRTFAGAPGRDVLVSMGDPVSKVPDGLALRLRREWQARIRD
jgi:hypothetical protein